MLHRQHSGLLPIMRTPEYGVCCSNSLLKISFDLHLVYHCRLISCHWINETHDLWFVMALKMID